MGERYVHATKFRSHCQPPSTVIDVRRCDPYRPPALARDHPSGRVVPSGAPLLRAPAVVPQAPRTYLQRTTTRPEARLRAGRYDPTGCDRASGPRRPGSAPWKSVEVLTESSNGAHWTDLGAEPDRSRRGTRPISVKGGQAERNGGGERLPRPACRRRATPARRRRPAPPAARAARGRTARPF